jgi:ABC-type tungstate transport system permease subunit
MSMPRGLLAPGTFDHFHHIPVLGGRTWSDAAGDAWNDFVIVGPRDGAAGIKGAHDAVAALKAIYATKAPVVSRGDNSGTNALEKRLWKTAANAQS